MACNILASRRPLLTLLFVCVLPLLCVWSLPCGRGAHKSLALKTSFLFIHHPPDLVCKIAAIEPDSRMYLLGVSTDSLSDWVNRVQNQLNHVLTQGSKLDESGDLDQVDR